MATFSLDFSQQVSAAAVWQSEETRVKRLRCCQLEIGG
jgi:hypothetical protein